MEKVYILSSIIIWITLGLIAWSWQNYNGYYREKILREKMPFRDITHFYSPVASIILIVIYSTFGLISLILIYRWLKRDDEYGKELDKMIPLYPEFYSDLFKTRYGLKLF